MLKSQCVTRISIVPTNCSATHELYVGLIMQYHYVSLVKICVHHGTSNIDNPTASATVSDADTTSTEPKIHVAQ